VFLKHCYCLIFRTLDDCRCSEPKYNCRKDTPYRTWPRSFLCGSVCTEHANRNIYKNVCKLLPNYTTLFPDLQSDSRDNLKLGLGISSCVRSRVLSLADSGRFTALVCVNTIHLEPKLWMSGMTRKWGTLLLYRKVKNGTFSLTCLWGVLHADKGKAVPLQVWTGP
jgi:hypothetical protein